MDAITAGEWLVAPLGQYQFARWDCWTCGPGDSRITADDARTLAAAHVRETGHTVEVERGTREMLAGVAVR